MADFPDNSKITIVDVYAQMKFVYNTLARPMWVEPGTGRVRASIEAWPTTLSAVTIVTTVTTVTTVATVTTLNQIAGLDASLVHIRQLKKTSWALGVRPRVT